MRMLLLFALLASVPRVARADSINAIVGDASWIARHGHAPSAGEDRRERERVETHLAWVESELRRREVSHLAPQLKERRARLLDVLAEYRGRARFPRNAHHDGRRPRFVDDDGNVCAVGHLIEVSAGRALTDAIDARFEYERLLDMRDERLDAWIAGSGLSAIELAMIQPGYSRMPERPTRPVEPPPPSPWTEAQLTALLATASPDIEQCAAGDRTRAVRVAVRHDRRRGVRVRVGVSPSAPRVAQCVDALVRASIARARASAPTRPLSVSRTYRLGLSAEARARQDAARALDGRLVALERCMPPDRSGKRAVLRVRVDEGGQLSLVSARLPMRADAARRRSIGSLRHSREQVLACFAEVVAGSRVETPGTAVELTHRIRWGGSASLLSSIGSGAIRGIGLTP